MHFNNEHFAEVEILSFTARCKLDGMSYEQTVEVRLADGLILRLFDFMGFAVNESRLGKHKKIVLCVPYIDGEVAILESGTPQVVQTDFDWGTQEPSMVTMIARILDTSNEDQDLLVDVGFGELYVIPSSDVSRFKVGDIIEFTARRVDLIEILE
ncbi:MAG: hypothetical protein Kow0099_33900 [Candidatus Abyssubacteria bacterium]